VRVIATLTIDGIKETRLEGDSAIFDSPVDYQKGYNKRLAAIGFWLENWRYAGHGGRNHNNRVFVPWSSALYVQEVKK